MRNSRIGIKPVRNPKKSNQRRSKAGLYVRSLVLVAALGLPIAGDARLKDNHSWKTKITTDGVTVKDRVTESGEFSFKAITDIDASVLEIIAVLRDVENWPTWLYNCRTARIMKWRNPRSFFFYADFKGPFPLKDRDLYALARFRVKRKKRHLQLIAQAKSQDWQSAPNGRVRIKEFEMRFTLIPSKLNKGKTTTVVWEVHSDFSGWVPGPMKNYLLRNMAHLSLKRLKTRIARGGYNRAFYNRYERYKNWH